jgi:hypothetical protein
MLSSSSRPSFVGWSTRERSWPWRCCVFYTVCLALVLAGDFGLHWLLDRMRAHATLLTHVPGESHRDTCSRHNNATCYVTAVEPGVQLEVVGRGLVADMLRNISAALHEAGDATDEEPLPDLDPAACLPSPSPPDLNTYTQIGETKRCNSVYYYHHRFS